MRPAHVSRMACARFRGISAVYPSSAGTCRWQSTVAALASTPAPQLQPEAEKPIDNLAVNFFFTRKCNMSCKFCEFWRLIFQPMQSYQDRYPFFVPCMRRERSLLT